MAASKPVPIVSALDITPERFQEQYINQNQPVVLRDATTHWPAATRCLPCAPLTGGIEQLCVCSWTHEFFQTELGDQECDVFLESRHRKGEKWHTTFSEYIGAFDRSIAPL